LTEEQINIIAEISSAVCYPANYVIFEEGEVGDRLYFLVKGEVEVSYKIGEEGLAKVDTVAGEEIVGCSALVEPYTYTATERSLTEIEVLEVALNPLRALMKKDCDLGFKIQQHVIEILTERIIDLRLG
jgi:CRP-like cAMP-binding protein